MRKNIFIFLWLFTIALGSMAKTPFRNMTQLLAESPLLQTSHIGLMVMDLDTDAVIYAYQPFHLFRPASTLKLITTLTALHYLGEEYNFSTTLELKQDTLLVRGGLDPEFMDQDLDTLVMQLPADIQWKHLAADLSLTDSLYWGSGWSWDDAPFGFQPYISPLMLNRGRVDITLRPTKKGETASIECVPASTYYQIINGSISRQAKAGKLTVSRNWLEHGNIITISGNVSRVRTESVSIFPSQDFFMYQLAHKLEYHDTWTYQHFPKDQTLEICQRTHSLTQVAKTALVHSDNLCAEALLYHIGLQHNGNPHACRDDGIAAVQKFLDNELHIDADSYCMVDGCGLSVYNQISANLLVQCLRFAHFHHPELYTFLPIAGGEGTLQYRMHDSRLKGNVHAKTGTVSGVSTLAGYLTAQNGHLMAFAILNQDFLHTAQARQLQDEICKLIYEIAF